MSTLYLDVLQSLSAGPRSWVDSSLVTTGAEAILNRPYLSETLTTSDATLIPLAASATIARTIVFTAPADCTIRNLIFSPANFNTAGNYVVFYESIYQCFLGKITIAGSGPDVGTWVDGFGVPGGLFALPNLLRAPKLNYRLAAGDTISFTVYYLGGQSTPPSSPPLSYNASLTYDLGQDNSVQPAYFIGGPAAPGAAAAVSSTAATGTIQITATPTSPGDYISLVGFEDGATTKSGGVLNGSAGGGGAGTNSWDTNTVGITAIRDAILAAFQDGTNDFGDYAFAAVSTDQISVTRNAGGSFGNFDTFVTNSASISLSGSGTLSGGLAGTANIPLVAPAVGVTLEKVVVQQGSSGVLPTAILNTVPPEFVALNVGGSPTPAFPGLILSPDENRAGISEGSLFVPSATTLSVDVQNARSSVLIFACAVGR